MSARSLILRAELHHTGGTLITHTLTIGATEMTLACARVVTRGEVVRVRLSFPGLVEGFDVEARAVSTDRGDGHGRPPSATFEIVAVAGSARATLEQFVAFRSSAPPESARDERRYRGLLVEDNAFIRDLFAFALERFCADRGAHIAVDAATTAEEAWELLMGDRYDLAIVDYYLPAETGTRLIERIRADPRFAALGVVAISVGGEAVRDASLDAGADLFLDKPLAMRDLLATLDKLTREARSVKTIVVMDDSAIVLETVRSVLEGAGYAVSTALNLEELEAARANTAPDLFILDVQMPEAFGDDVARVLREVRQVKVPILLFSALDEAVLAARARDAGVDGYVAKGAGLAALLASVASLLGA